MLNPIPNIYHVVFFGFTPFMYTHYLSILTCLLVQKPDTLYIYTHHKPSSEWWDKLIKHKLFIEKARLETVDLPTQIFGNPIVKYQHMADVIRLQKLIERGGVYIDLDIISLKSLQPILTNKINISKGCVMGVQCPNTKYMGLCNAVIIATPNSKFLKKWYLEYKTFRKSRWDHHSVKLPYILSQLIPECIQTLPSSAFFPITWEEPKFMKDYSLDHKMSKSFLVHIWHSEWSKSVLKGEGPWLLQKKSTFSKLVSGILQTTQSKTHQLVTSIRSFKNKKKITPPEKSTLPEKEIESCIPKSSNHLSTKKSINNTIDNKDLKSSHIHPTVRNQSLPIIPIRDDISSHSKQVVYQDKLTQINNYYQQLPIIFKAHAQETIAIKKIKAQYNLHHLIKTKNISTKMSLKKPLFTLQRKTIDAHLSFFPDSIYPINDVRAIYPEFNKYNEFTWCDIINKQLITISKHQCILNLVKYYINSNSSKEKPPYYNSIHYVTSQIEIFRLFTNSFTDTQFFILNKKENIFRICYIYQEDSIDEMRALENLTLPTSICLFSVQSHPTIPSSYSIIKNRRCLGFIAKSLIAPLKLNDRVLSPRFPNITNRMFDLY